MNFLNSWTVSFAYKISLEELLRHPSVVDLAESLENE
jgi:hypothetical protein